MNTPLPAPLLQPDGRLTPEQALWTFHEVFALGLRCPTSEEVSALHRENVSPLWRPSNLTRCALATGHPDILRMARELREEYDTVHWVIALRRIHWSVCQLQWEHPELFREWELTRDEMGRSSLTSCEFIGGPSTRARAAKLWMVRGLILNADL